MRVSCHIRIHENFSIILTQSSRNCKNIFPRWRHNKIQRHGNTLGQTTALRGRFRWIGNSTSGLRYSRLNYWIALYTKQIDMFLNGWKREVAPQKQLKNSFTFFERFPAYYSMSIGTVAYISKRTKGKRNELCKVYGIVLLISQSGNKKSWKSIFSQ